MNQIKARIFSREKRQMIPVRSLYLDLDIAYAGDMGDLMRFYLSNVDLMLWTQYQDVNGIDIYELDYITSDELAEPILVKDVLHFGYLLHTYGLENLRVIGNRFQSPQIEASQAS